jgi:programmed cell death protein 5
MTEQDRELEELRRRELEELQRRVEEERRAQIEAAQRRVALKKILTPEALARLDNIRVVRPELAAALEQQLIGLAASGKVRVPVDEETLKKILEMVYSRTRREFRIRF